MSELLPTRWMGKFETAHNGLITDFIVTYLSIKTKIGGLLKCNFFLAGRQPTRSFDYSVNYHNPYVNIAKFTIVRTFWAGAEEY